MTQIPYIRYEGIPLQQIFAWVHEGAGERAVRPMQAGLENVSKAFIAATDNIRSTMQSLGVQWQGTAASAAGSALAGVSNSSAAQGKTAEKAGNNAEGHGVDFENLRSKVAYRDPGPYSFYQKYWDYTLQTPWGPLFGIESDYREAVEQNQASTGEAVRAMYDYENQARSRVATFPAAVDDPTFGSAGAGVGGGGGFPSAPIGGGLGGTTPGVGAPPPAGPPGLGGRPGPGSLAAPAPGGDERIGVGPDAAIRPGGPAGVGDVGPLPTSPAAKAPPSPSVLAPGPWTPPPGSPIPAVPAPDPPGIAFGGAGLPGTSSSSRTPTRLPSTGRAFRADLLRSAEPTVTAPRGAEGRISEGRVSEPSPARTGAASTSMYPPMGGAGGRGADRSHRTRYSVPSSAPFEVDVPHVAPVIGADE